MKRCFFLPGTALFVMASFSTAAERQGILTVKEVHLRDAEATVVLQNHSSKEVQAWCLSVIYSKSSIDRSGPLFVFDAKMKIGSGDIVPIPPEGTGTSSVCLRSGPRPNFVVVAVELGDGSFIGTVEGVEAIRSARQAAEKSRQAMRHFQRMDKAHIRNAIRRAKALVNSLRFGWPDDSESDVR